MKDELLTPDRNSESITRPIKICSKLTIDSNKEKVKILSLFLKYILNSNKIFKILERIEDKLDQYNKIMIEQNNKLEIVMQQNT